MRVTLVQAHPSTAPSMRRIAQALQRYLPLPTSLVYVSLRPLARPRCRLPESLMHTWYALYTRRWLQRLAARLPPAEVYHLVDHSESFLLPFLRARQKVVSCHDLMPLVENRLYRNRFSRWWGGYLYQLTISDLVQADGVIASSHATAQELLRRFDLPSAKVKVVYLGVDAEFYIPLPETERRRCREAMGFHAEELVVLHVGSNAPYKNVETVLRVVAILHDGGHRVRWVKAGEPLAAPLRRQVRQLGIAQCVQEEPHVDDPGLRLLYQTCDVLLFPSWREGFGLPVLEALACGTPAVIADTPALHEWAGEVCLSAPPQAVEALAEKVLQSVEYSYNPAYRERLREFALQFDWRWTAERIARAYDEWRTP
ncbi:MAG: glycosyltransferase family 1 protein [Armatimonadota bacterium]|nr:glycosyltransferase family 1 protein [Armatimonadota bacterium]